MHTFHGIENWQNFRSDPWGKGGDQNTVIVELPVFQFWNGTVIFGAGIFFIFLQDYKIGIFFLIFLHDCNLERGYTFSFFSMAVLH